MDEQLINLYDYEQAAKARLDRGDYDHVAGGATDEITLRRTRTMLDSIMLRPRMLVDISTIDTSTTLLGERVSFPVLTSPAGGHGRFHPEAERATARAVAGAGTIMVVSSAASLGPEEIADAADGPKWFQQYLFREPGLTLEKAQRAEAAGYRALCVTVDSTLPAKRERNIRNGYKLGSSPNYKDLLPAGYVGAHSAMVVDRTSTWAHLGALVSETTLPVVAKGVMTAEDALLCVEHGVRGILVSNHGARQLDSTFATIEVLPEVVDAVAGRCEVYLDGGIRRGTDIVKALALGANAVLIGRPIFWGLTLDGEAGARAVLEILRDELAITMGMCGHATVATLDRRLLGFTSPLAAALAT